GRSPDRNAASPRRTRRNPSGSRTRGGSSVRYRSCCWLLATNGLDEFDGVAHARLDAGVVGLGEQLLGDEVAADAAGDDAGPKPLAQRFLGGFDAAGGHDARPRHGSEHVLDELRAAHRTTGEHLDDLAAQLVRIGNLAGRAASGRVRNAAAIADLGDVGIQDGADDELRAVGDVDARGRRIDNRADAHDHRRVRLVEVPRDFVEHVRGEVAAIGEFDALGAAVRAGLDDLLTDLDIRVIEDRDYRLVDHRGEHTHSILVHLFLRESSQQTRRAGSPAGAAFSRAAWVAAMESAVRAGQKTGP